MTAPISGTTQVLTLESCPHCGGENPPRVRFCNSCGEELRSAGSSQAPLRPTVPSGDALDHVADPLIGRVIAERYRIQRLLGRGGMGVVYLVEHASIGKLMALKLLTGELTRDRELVARFKREALMVSQLSHPNTVQVFDFGTADGLTYLAMEYLDGRDLGNVIDNDGHIDPVRATKLMIQACGSLAEAHGKDIVHRDIKPENLFLLENRNSTNEVLKVLDFGLAKLRESSDLGEVTTRGAIVGTPYYMSPEQVRGEEVDHRSDIYALGAVLYKALTGKPAFDAATPVGVLTKHLTDTAAPPSSRFPKLNIPSSLSQIVVKAMAKQPEERFQSVEELREALIGELRRSADPTGIDELLDSKAVRGVVNPEDAIATRDEVERYERKLRRRGYVTWSVIVTLSLGAGAAAAVLLLDAADEEPVFSGAETEPNNVASEATTVPFGVSVKGTLGKRLDPKRSDRDFYRIHIPEGNSLLSLKTTSLPNMSLCTHLYREGVESELGRYCPGTPGIELSIPQLQLQPGTYLVGVMQDQNRYDERTRVHTHENISDEYQLDLQATPADNSREVEPNDQARLATRLSAGNSLTGSIGWMKDVDVVCAAKGSTAPLHFIVEDAIDVARPDSAVLNVTPIGGPSDGIPVRVHRSDRTIDVSERDQLSPWKGPTVNDLKADLCVKLELVPNPLAPRPHPLVAPAGTERYRVRLAAGAKP